MFSGVSPSLPLHIAVCNVADRGRKLSKISAKSDAKRELNALHRAWLLALVKATGRKLSRLAADAGLSESALTRIVNDENYTGVLSPLTINRLVAKFPLPGPDAWTPGTPLLGTGAEAVRLADDDAEAAGCCSGLRSRIPAIEIWRMQGRALDAIGYMPGDLLAVYPGAAPAAGDVVMAHLFAHGADEPEAILRVLEPPYLVAASFDTAFRKPLLVDNDRVIVRGVVVASMRGAF